SLWTITGAAVSHTLFFIVASAGLAAILMASAQVFIILKWFGVCYLIWLGLTQIFSKELQVGAAAGNNRESISSLFLRGITVNSTNPKALVFYSTFFPPFIDPNLNLLPQLLILGTTFVTIFIAVAAVHAWSAEKLGGIFRSGSKLSVVKKTSGAVLVGAGVLLASVSRE
ncbi:MAG: LysE family translocator, partial [Proteobacteria bacterium]|nr:LysE family translocator [Pseudomonadota bacterium]